MEKIKHLTNYIERTISFKFSKNMTEAEINEFLNFKFKDYEKLEDKFKNIQTISSTKYDITKDLSVNIHNKNKYRLSIIVEKTSL